MQLVYSYYIKDKEIRGKDIDKKYLDNYTYSINKLNKYSRVSNSLYNQSSYMMLDNYNTNKTYMSYNDVYDNIKYLVDNVGKINYRELPAQVAQRTLKKSCKDYLSFCKLYKLYKNNGIKDKPNLPHYKKSGGKFMLVYPNQKASIKNGWIQLAKDIHIPIPQYDKYKSSIDTFNCIRLIPTVKNGFKVDIVYTIEEQSMTTNKMTAYNTIGIDMGVKNTMAVVSIKDCRLYNGGNTKAVNQYYNKRMSIYRSQQDKDGKIDRNINRRKIKNASKKRNNSTNNEFHKISRDVINFCIHNDIKYVVIGHNTGWKQKSNMGAKNNQTFHYIPYNKLINMIIYKAQKYGITVIVHEERYTSICDSIALETICKHEQYSGKRVKRGLYKSSCGKLLNADINGAVNIVRKVIGDEAITPLINSGCLCQPRKIYC